MGSGQMVLCTARVTTGGSPDQDVGTGLGRPCQPVEASSLEESLSVSCRA